MGKLRFRWRCLISSQREQCTLLSKVIQEGNTGTWFFTLCPGLPFSVVRLCQDHWTTGLLGLPQLWPLQAGEGRGWGETPALPV